jgi:hypothetical protein
MLLNKELIQHYRLMAKKRAQDLKPASLQSSGFTDCSHFLPEHIKYHSLGVMIMKQIHIAFLAEYIYALFNPHWGAPFGGAEVDLYNLAVYLAKNPRYCVTIYVGDFGQTDEIEIYQNVRLKKIRMFGWPKRNPWQKAVLYTQLWKTLWSSDADIIFTKMAGHLVGWAAIFFKLLKKDKILLHRLGSDRDTTFTEPALSGGRRIYYLYRYGLNKADLIFSQTVQQQRPSKRTPGNGEPGCSKWLFH